MPTPAALKNGNLRPGQRFRATWAAAEASVCRSAPASALAGSHLGWTAAVLYGRGWTWKPSIPGCVDGYGHPRTPLGHLRIRRLGVRVAPGAPTESLAVAGDLMCRVLVEKVLAGQPLGAIRPMELR